MAIAFIRATINIFPRDGFRYNCLPVVTEVVVEIIPFRSYIAAPFSLKNKNHCKRAFFCFFFLSCFSNLVYKLMSKITRFIIITYESPWYSERWGRSRNPTACIYYYYNKYMCSENLITRIRVITLQ